MILSKTIMKSWRYILIVFINAGMLMFLLLFLIDKFELRLNGFIIPTAIFKIIGVSILSLAGIILIRFCINKTNIENRKHTKVLLSIFLTLTLSSFLYIESSKITHNFP